MRTRHAPCLAPAGVPRIVRNSAGLPTDTVLEEALSSMPPNLPSPLQRFRTGELDRDGYLEALIEEALAPIAGLPRRQLELVRATLRDLVASDPALLDLVRLATLTPGRP